jgi:hypothetical protein
MVMYGAARKNLVLEDEVIVPPRDGLHLNGQDIHRVTGVKRKSQT